jgi:hypothetical protein
MTGVGAESAQGRDISICQNRSTGRMTGNRKGSTSLIRIAPVPSSPGLLGWCPGTLPARDGCLSLDRLLFCSSTVGLL